MSGSKEFPRDARPCLDHAYAYAPFLDQSPPKLARNPTKVASQAICRRPPAKRSRIRPRAFKGLVFRLLGFVHAFAGPQEVKVILSGFGDETMGLVAAVYEDAVCGFNLWGLT